MMDPEGDPQESELGVLRSIIGDEWRDLPPKKAVWGKTEEKSWEVILAAPDDERIKVILTGRLPKQYPHVIPVMTLSDPKNLSPEHVKLLHKELQERAKTKVGYDMIWDLVIFAREWISEHHLSLPNIHEVVPNLMELKAQREQAQKDAERAQREAEEQERIAQAAEQDRLLTERIQLDVSRKSERQKQLEQEEDERRKLETLSILADGELESRLLMLDEEVEVEGYQGSWRTWALFGGRKEALWTTYSAEPDALSGSFVRATLPTVDVHVVDFSNPYYSSPQGKKKVDGLCHDVTRLKEIRCENVMRILAVKRDRSPKNWERLLIMTETTRHGIRMSHWSPKDGFAESQACGYFAQILDGLSEIHRMKSTQKQIDPEYVLLFPGRNGDHIAKLCGTSYAQRICDIHLSNPFLKNHSETIEESWKSPEELESPYEYPARRDIWQAALLFLQLLFGQQCLVVYPNLEVLLQHSQVSSSIVELIRAMMHPNPKKRLTADEAIDRLKNRDVSSTNMGLNRSTSSVDIAYSPNHLFGSSPNFGRPGSYFPVLPPNSKTRYREDYIEVEYLGKGGFGEVVKVRNKLDNSILAVKKVKLRQGYDVDRVLREVRNMSSIKHPHIVDYKGSFIEDVQPIEPETESETGSASTPTAGIVEEGSDIFRPNFNDISFSRPEHSRSASFPSVRFANDEDDEESDDQSTASSDSDDTIPDPSSRPAPRAIPQTKPSLSITDATSDAHNVKSILYIVMEFVEKQTLRELITAGLSEEESWVLMKQILDALAHLASIKIVHRDLKPSNILINSLNQVKIADFGLSTTNMTATEPALIGTDTHIGDGGVGDEIDRTSNIGTSLYIAPEVKVSRSYDEKADMYSLGVIFFEMCFKFNTQMERAQILTALRQRSVDFPTAWTGMMDQRKIITTLLQHEPEKRPSAQQLLRDPLLPNPERDQQKYLDAIDEMTNPSSTYYPRLVSALFDAESRMLPTSTDNRLDDYTYDNKLDDDAQSELQLWITAVQQRLGQLFQRHGALEAHLPLLIPDTTLLSFFRPISKPAKFLDANGKIVRLPESNLLRMARNATRRHIERIKRYHIGDRFESNVEGQPRVSNEMSFDIVSPLRSFAAEAELLDLTDKVLLEFKGARTPAFADYDIHVSHEGVLATILGAVPDKHVSDVARLFRQTGSTWTAELKGKLHGFTGIPRPLLDDIDQCCAVDEFRAVRSRLDSIFHSARSKVRLSPALQEMEDIIGLAETAGVKRQFLFRPTMSRHAEYFKGGFMFEVVRRGKSAQQSSPEILAYGGRYDALLEHFKEPALSALDNLPSRRVFGVGMSLSTNLIAHTVWRYESALIKRLMNKDMESERSFGYWTPARCQVYICASGMDLQGRMGLVGELWRSGISADMQYDDDRSQIEVEKECLDQNTLFLLVPRKNGQSIKIRPILKKGSEVDVSRGDLISYLRAAITEQRRVDAGYAFDDPASGLHTAPISHEGQKGAEAEIRLVLPPEPQVAKGTKGRPIKKHRHSTKPIYYERAEEFSSRVGTNLPILGIDLPTLFIHRLTLDTAWIKDDEQWRSVMSETSLPTSERKYADMVREAVREMTSIGFGAGSGVGVGGSSSGMGLNTSTGSGSGGGGGGGGGGIEEKRGAAGWVWLFSVREGKGGKGFLLQTQPHSK